jgi:hypothetical protein
MARHPGATLGALRSPRLLVILLTSLAVAMTTVPGRARADRVVSQDSFWDADHDHIWSNVEIEHDDGSRETRLVFGGSVDGVAIRQYALMPGGTEQVLDWVNTRNTAGLKIHWGNSCVFVTPDEHGSSQIANGDEFPAIDASFDAWVQQTNGCSYLQVTHLKPAPVETGTDGINVVKFRESTWCAPAHGGMPENCHPSGATALTTVSYVDKPGRSDDGTILDADVEINGVEFTIGICTPGAGCATTVSNASQVEDLQNTLTHEAGHFFGLDHNCFVFDPQNPNRPHPVDDMNQPIPNCFPASALPPSITEATMYWQEAAGETKKRSLETDDQNGFCSLYPLAQDPHRCEPVTIDVTGGCQVAPGAPGRAPSVAVALALLALATAAAAARRARVKARACSRSRRR